MLLAAFAYQLTGNLAHELIGVILLMLLIVHVGFNRKRLFSPLEAGSGFRRVVVWAVNLSLLASMVLVLVTGIMISHDLFSLTNIDGGLRIKRLHLAGAYWALILVSVHLGHYWGRIWPWLLKKKAFSRILASLTKYKMIMAPAAVILGIKASFDRDIGVQSGF